MIPFFSKKNNLLNIKYQYFIDILHIIIGIVPFQIIPQYQSMIIRPQKASVVNKND